MNKLLRLKQVTERTGLSRSGLYHLRSVGSFPQPINIGVRTVAWVEKDVDDWISSKIKGEVNQLVDNASGGKTVKELLDIILDGVNTIRASEEIKEEEVK